MKKYPLMGALLITTITLSAQQKTLLPQAGVRVAEHQISPATALDESALLEEFYHMEELAAFDLVAVPERMQQDKVAEVRETPVSDIKSNEAAASLSRQAKTRPAFTHYSSLVPGSKVLSARSNHFQAPGLLSIFPKLFLSFPRVFKMIGK